LLQPSTKSQLAARSHPAAARDIQRSILPNGIRIITETMPHVRSVSVGVWIGTGSRRETPEEQGISHFIEHMLFKGTTSRSAEDIARSVDSIGGNLDAFTGKEMVCYNTKVLDEHLPIAMDVLSDLVLHPKFDAEDIEKEKGVILEEIKMDADNPDGLVHEIFSSNFWKDHSLGRAILGTRETVKAFTRTMIIHYYRRIYSPENIVITAAGNLDHGSLADLVRPAFAAIKPTAPVPPLDAPATHARISLRSKKDLEQVHLCMGVPSFGVAHEERFNCYVLNTVLGGGMSSRLFQNIREKRGLAYAVFSEIMPYADTGCLTVYAGTSLESAKHVVDCVMKEFRSLKEEPVPAEELRRSKDHLKGSLMLGLESTSSRMSNLARQELHFGRFFTLDELVEGIEKVTEDDAQRIARTFFDTERVAVAVLGNLGKFKLTRDDLVC
jgi:predicted Zn-dependent peptidase